MDEKTKVLMTADTVGGVWTYALELAKALENRATVVLATMGPRPSNDQRKAATRLGIVLEESEFNLEWMHNPWDDVDAAGDWLLDLERRHDPQIIHLNGYAHGNLPWRAPVLMVGHSCVCSWWSAVHKEPAPPEWNEYRTRTMQGLYSAEIVCAPTRAMLECLEHHYGYLPHGRAVLNGASAPNGNSPKKTPIVFTAGRLWDEAKNVTKLADVANELPWPVYVAGSDETPAGHRPVPTSLRALGRLELEEVHQWMDQAAIYALPARYEPFGLSILEAAQRQCALVLGDIPSLRELWHGAALFVDPEDSAALKTTLEGLMQDEERVREMGEKARIRSRRYTPELMARAYCDTYSDLVGVGATG